MDSSLTGDRRELHFVNAEGQLGVQYPFWIQACMLGNKPVFVVCLLGIQPLKYGEAFNVLQGRELKQPACAAFMKSWGRS